MKNCKCIQSDVTAFLMLNFTHCVMIFFAKAGVCKPVQLKNLFINKTICLLQIKDQGINQRFGSRSSIKNQCRNPNCRPRVYNQVRRMKGRCVQSEHELVSGGGAKTVPASLDMVRMIGQDLKIACPVPCWYQTCWERLNLPSWTLNKEKI